jgi:hypothetical protein
LRIGGLPGPHPRRQGGRELASRHDADHDGAEAQLVMNMKRENRKRGSNHQKAD